MGILGNPASKVKTVAMVTRENKYLNTNFYKFSIFNIFYFVTSMGLLCIGSAGRSMQKRHYLGQVFMVGLLSVSYPIGMFVRVTNVPKVSYY